MNNNGQPRFSRLAQAFRKKATLILCLITMGSASVHAKTQPASDERCIAASLVLYQRTLVPDYVVSIKDSVIQGLFPKSDQRWESCQEKEEYEGILAPGFIDIHIHGANGSDVMGIIEDPKALKTIASYLPEEGVTSWYPTTASASAEDLSAILTRIASHAGNQTIEEASIEGIHLEGPFISKLKKGCHHEGDLLPISVENLDDWKASAGELLRIITFAPELDNSDKFIQWCNQNNVIASIGHTAATEAQTLHAIEQGAHMGTHLFNAMSMPGSRDAGAAFSILSAEKFPFEMIMDGHHLSETNVKLAWLLSQNSPERFVIITDAMSAKGMKNREGTFLIGKDIKIRIQDGKSLRADSDKDVLAGSIATMPHAVNTMRRVTQCSLEQALLAASHHPALSVGLTEKGLLEEGYDADMVLLSDSEKLSVLATWRSGQKIFTANTAH